MKKYTILFFLLACLFRAEAQTAENPAAMANANVTEETRQWQKTLQLTDLQYRNLLKHNAARTAALETIRQQFRYDLTKRDSSVSALEARFDAEFAGIMNEKQFAGYLELQGRNVNETILKTVSVNKPAVQIPVAKNSVKSDSLINDPQTSQTESAAKKAVISLSEEKPKSDR